MHSSPQGREFVHFLKKHFFEAATRAIDRQDVSTTQGYPSRPPGTDAGGLAAATADIASKITFWVKIVTYPHWCATQASMSQNWPKVTILRENVAQKIT